MTVVAAVVVDSAVEEDAAAVVSAGCVWVVVSAVVVPTGFDSVVVADVALAGSVAGIVLVVAPEQAAVLKIMTDVRIKTTVSFADLFFMFHIFLLNIINILHTINISRSKLIERNSGYMNYVQLWLPFIRSVT